ncbi:hypoxia-inducible factor 1-alpha inhibitor-like [Tachypleus tridentatus]|uniref:hypoxia-inducible factor 1-alpha inhibitor-like n=1 Tax=Tachypleus tridentatus TaxID=6853 RepID=UPI003FCFE8EB
MSENGKTFDELHFQPYDFPTVSIPRLSHLNPDADRLISEMKPVVLTDTELVASAQKWNLDYLEKNIGSGSYTVYLSNNKKFKYFDESKIQEHNLNFTPPTERTEMKFWDFAECLRNWKAGEKRLYLQQPLNDTVGKNMVDDFLSFNWNWIARQKKENNWGPLTSNLLLISTPGNITPVHYDEQENFFAQIHGYKRFILFSPDCYDKLYPHPVWHPHDRQSQVDFDVPQYDKFPKFHDISGQEAVLGPGDVLYLPMYWWHHVETLQHGDYVVSLNFWYKSGPSGKITYPLQGFQKMAVMRNIEKMLVETLKDVNEVGPLLQALVEGRYT